MSEEGGGPEWYSDLQEGGSYPWYQNTEAGVEYYVPYCGVYCRNQ